jgi:REP element-mobilizing transposase RayT
LETVKKYRKKYDFQIYAFCIMINHVHLLIKVGEIPLSKIMQGITQSFTQKMNRKYDQSGHIFEGRYFASLCGDLGSIMNTIAYIHLNPVKAGVSETPDYEWSSHFAYEKRGLLKQSPEKNIWFDSRGLMRQLNGNTKKAKKMYNTYIEMFMNEAYYPEIVDMDIIQEPLTLDLLIKKLEADRKYFLLDQIVAKACEIYGSNIFEVVGARMKKADGMLVDILRKAVILLNKKMKLISNAELARRVRISRSIVVKTLNRALTVTDLEVTTQMDRICLELGRNAGQALT